MLQHIGNNVYHVEYTPQPAKNSDIIFAFKTRRIFTQIDENKKFHFPTFERVKNKIEEHYLQFLFKMNDTCYYLYDAPLEIDGFTYENISYVRSMKRMSDAFAAMTAYHLFVWYDSHRFCGKCGQPMRPMANERALKCTHCEHQSYPVIAPAVIVGVTDGDNILITRYAGREYTGVALLAGFCEIGESAEDTVRREVMEEVGLKVKNIRYFDSQPWGIDSNLLFGYFAEVDGSTEICMDTHELREAVWMPRENLKPARNLMSLTMTMIEAFRKGEDW